MRNLGAGLCLGIVSLSFGQSPTPTQVVGTWKYDVSTLRFSLNANGREAFENPRSNVRGSFQRIKDNFAKGASLLVMKFEPNHQFEASIGKHHGSGTWSIKSGHVFVSLSQGAGVMEFIPSKSNSRMVAVFRRPSFGEMSVVAVRTSQRS